MVISGFSLSSSIQEGASYFFNPSSAFLNMVRCSEEGRTEILSPFFTSKEGTSTFLSFTKKWPWETIWRACFLVEANPERNTTLSSLRSNFCKNSSGELPWAVLPNASFTYLLNCFSLRLYCAFKFCFSSSCLPYSDCGDGRRFLITPFCILDAPYFSKPWTVMRHWSTIFNGLNLKTLCTKRP